MNLVMEQLQWTSISIRFAAETIKRHRQVSAVINFLLFQALIGLIYNVTGFTISDPLVYVVGFFSIFFGMVIYAVIVDSAKNLVYSVICEMTDEQLNEHVHRINHTRDKTGWDFKAEQGLQMFWKDHEMMLLT